VAGSASHHAFPASFGSRSWCRHRESRRRGDRIPARRCWAASAQPSDLLGEPHSGGPIRWSWRGRPKLPSATRLPNAAKVKQRKGLATSHVFPLLRRSSRSIRRLMSLISTPVPLFDFRRRPSNAPFADISDSERNRRRAFIGSGAMQLRTMWRVADASPHAAESSVLHFRRSARVPKFLNNRKCGAHSDTSESRHKQSF
jgi:hypothetical protein